MKGEGKEGRKGCAWRVVSAPLFDSCVRTSASRFWNFAVSDCEGKEGTKGKEGKKKGKYRCVRINVQHTEGERGRGGTNENSAASATNTALAAHNQQKEHIENGS
jgi:hypothetical protein